MDSFWASARVFSRCSIFFSFAEKKDTPLAHGLGDVPHALPGPRRPSTSLTSLFSLFQPQQTPIKTPWESRGGRNPVRSLTGRTTRSRPPEQLGLGTILCHRNLPCVFGRDVAIVSYLALLLGDTGWRPCPRGGGPSCKLRVWSFPKNVRRREPRTCPDLLKLSIPVLPLLSFL